MVKFYQSEKGFGFIKTDGGEFFFHVSAVRSSKELQKDDKVSFELVDGKRGPQAANVNLV